MALTPHSDEKKLLVGKINGFFGVQGWIKIFSYTEPRKNILEYQPWYFIDDGTYKAIEMTTGREQSKTIVAHLKGIDNKDQAGQISGRSLYNDKEQLPQLDGKEHYWHEIVGCRGSNIDGIGLGVVDYLVDKGSNNVLVIKGGNEHWIPYIEPYLVSIDKQNRIISVDWDENF